MKTTTVETSRLSGAALDWAVATAIGAGVLFEDWGGHNPWVVLSAHAALEWVPFSPSTNWSQGGPLIEQYGVWIASTCTRGAEWDATVTARTLVDAFGPTPLIAACRAIVAAELGDDVEVPAELVEASNA